MLLCLRGLSHCPAFLAAHVQENARSGVPGCGPSYEVLRSGGILVPVCVGSTDLRGHHSDPGGELRSSAFPLTRQS